MDTSSVSSKVWERLFTKLPKRRSLKYTVFTLVFDRKKNKYVYDILQNKKEKFRVSILYASKHRVPRQPLRPLKECSSLVKSIYAGYKEWKIKTLGASIALTGGMVGIVKGMSLLDRRDYIDLVTLNNRYKSKYEDRCKSTLVQQRSDSFWADLISSKSLKPGQIKKKTKFYTEIKNLTDSWYKPDVQILPTLSDNRQYGIHQLEEQELWCEVYSSCSDFIADLKCALARSLSEQKQIIRPVKSFEYEGKFMIAYSGVVGTFHDLLPEMQFDDVKFKGTVWSLWLTISQYIAACDEYDISYRTDMLSLENILVGVNNQEFHISRNSLWYVAKPSNMRETNHGFNIINIIYTFYRREQNPTLKDSLIELHKTSKADQDEFQAFIEKFPEKYGVLKSHLKLYRTKFK